MDRRTTYDTSNNGRFSLGVKMDKDTAVDHLLTSYGIGSRFSIIDKVYMRFHNRMIGIGDQYRFERCVNPYIIEMVKLGMTDEEILQFLENLSDVKIDPNNVSLSEILKYTIKCIESGETLSPKIYL